MTAGNFANLNGSRVIAGVVTIPHFGLWHADVTLAESIPLTNPITLTIGNLVLVGTETRAASFAGARTVRMVGGFGGWRKIVGSRYYQSDSGVMLSTVLGDLANEIGENVSIATDAAVGNAYTREAGSQAALVLAALKIPVWYVRPDGVTVIGPRASKRIATPFTVTGYTGSSGKIIVATEDLASFAPGNTFTAPTVPNVQTISAAIHSIDNGTVRTEVLAA